MSQRESGRSSSAIVRRDRVAGLDTGWVVRRAIAVRHYDAGTTVR
jgi:hypothetical protein